MRYHRAIWKGLLCTMGMLGGIVFTTRVLSDDTTLFCGAQSKINVPPPAVALFIDTSGSMTSLPCAVPDQEDACGIRTNISPLPNAGTPSSFFINIGYNPANDYGYSTGNPTCFDPNINPGGEGCFYGGITTTAAHVYLNGYFSTPPS